MTGAANNNKSSESIDVGQNKEKIEIDEMKVKTGHDIGVSDISQDCKHNTEPSFESDPTEFNKEDLEQKGFEDSKKDLIESQKSEEHYLCFLKKILSNLSSKPQDLMQCLIELMGKKELQIEVIDAIVSLGACSIKGLAPALQESTIEGVIMAMKEFPDNSQLQIQSHVILWYLSSIEQNKKHISKGLDYIFNAMDKLNDPKLLALANGILANLATNNEIQELISDDRIDLIMKDSTDLFVVTNAIGALWSLSTNSKKRQCIGDKGIGFIFDSMKKFNNNANLLTIANAALWTLATEDNNRENIGKRDGIELIIESIKKFPDDTLLLEKGIGALATLAELDENKKKILERDGLQQIKQSSHKVRNELVKWAEQKLESNQNNHSNTQLVH